MKQWIAFWNIMLKDMKAYYLKPPNISWGLIFPLPDRIKNIPVQAIGKIKPQLIFGGLR